MINNAYNFQKVAKMEPLDIIDWLNEEFMEEVPVGIETKEDAAAAGRLLGKLTNTYSYLCALSAQLSICARAQKQRCITKPNAKDTAKMEEYERLKNEYDLAAMRKASVDAFVDIVHQQYAAVSRMVTIKMEADKELMMTPHK